jgi:hypothetical protein
MLIRIACIRNIKYVKDGKFLSYFSYRLYMEIQNLMEVENVFLKRLGFQLEKKPKELLMSLTNE